MLTAAGKHNKCCISDSHTDYTEVNALQENHTLKDYLWESMVAMPWAQHDGVTGVSEYSRGNLSLPQMTCK